MALWNSSQIRPPSDGMMVTLSLEFSSTTAGSSLGAASRLYPSCMRYGYTLGTTP
ncbi:hypothetical protein D3C73_1387160 [compost metagenome]